MSGSLRFLLCLAAGLALMPTTLSQPPAAPKRASIEFRWLEDQPIKGVTEEKGFQTTCGPELSYAHKLPVLTNSAVAEARLTSHDFRANGLGGEMYMIAFHLTPEARKTLTAEQGDRPVRELAVFVDGKYWGTSIVRKGQIANLVPSAGFIPSKVEAERIVASCRQI